MFKVVDHFFAPPGNKPTYKGLKRQMASGSALVGPGNKPTYKGLKRPNSVEEYEALCASNKPTYKGLKLDVVSEAGFLAGSYEPICNGAKLCAHDWSPPPQQVAVQGFETAALQHPPKQEADTPGMEKE